LEFAITSVCHNGRLHTCKYYKHVFFIQDSFSADGTDAEKMYDLTQFLDLDMSGKVIVAALLPKYATDAPIVNTYRVSQRLQVFK
jgi:hypothetical protein